MIKRRDCNTFSPSIRSWPGQSAYASGLPVNARLMFNERAATCSSGEGEVKWIEKEEGAAKEGGDRASRRRGRRRGKERGRERDRSISDEDNHTHNATPPLFYFAFDRRFSLIAALPRPHAHVAAAPLAFPCLGTKLDQN
jgi:hypothetical protein